MILAGQFIIEGLQQVSLLLNASDRSVYYWMLPTGQFIIEGFQQVSLILNASGRSVYYWSLSTGQFIIECFRQVSLLLKTSNRSVKNSESIKNFLKRILSFIRPSPNSTFNCHNPKGIELLSRLRLGLSHLREHKFKHSFQDSLNPFCNCTKGEVESSSHYLLHCSNYLKERLALLNTIKNIDVSILQQIDSKFTSVFFFRQHFLQQ